MKRIKFSPTLGHLTNFCTNFYDFFFNFGKFVKIRDFFAEVTNSRSMVHAVQDSCTTVVDDLFAQFRRVIVVGVTKT